MSTVTVQAVMFTLTIATTILGSQIANSSQRDNRWWDLFHDYYYYGPEFTSAIDQVLMDTQDSICNREMITPGKYRPAIGYHEFRSKELWKFWPWPGFLPEFLPLSSRSAVVSLEKREDPISKQIMYRAWIANNHLDKSALQEFEQTIMSIQSNAIQVYSIDTSGTEPRLRIQNKICRSPRSHQQQILDLILSQYTETNHFNVKLLISGPRGSGKTWIGRLLKKAMNVSARLYDDFDPTSVGVNINTLALAYASVETPVILLIDEIDQTYRYVMNEVQDFDPRLRHARNKRTFNQMMDSLADTPYTISIFTTEMSFEELYANETYRSFFRSGRIDYRVAMTKDSVMIVPNVFP